MKSIYEIPVIESLEVKKEDIITLSYMLPEMSIDRDVDPTSDYLSENSNGSDV